MTRYRVEVRITPRKGLLDPEGRAVHSALTSLGYEAVEEVRVGRLVHLTIEAESEGQAVEQTREMCERLIANPVTEQYQIEVVGEDRDG